MNGCRGRATPAWGLRVTTAEDVGVTAARGAQHPTRQPRVVRETNVETCRSHLAL
jgi:hypothetical protein